MDGPFSCGQDLHGFYAQPNQKFEAANVGRHHVCDGGSECLSFVGKAVHRVARKPDAAGALGDMYVYIYIYIYIYTYRYRNHGWNATVLIKRLYHP